MIEIEGLKKRFGQSIALDEVSMHVRDGAMYGFVGPNDGTFGSGWRKAPDQWN